MAAIRLGSASVFSYLVGRGLCSPEDQMVNVRRLPGKNLNLLVYLLKADSSAEPSIELIVKQGPIGRSGIPRDGFAEEWSFSTLLRSHSELAGTQSLVSNPIAYDKENEIIVYRYYQPYGDLGDFYAESRFFPPIIATAVGATLASLHAALFERSNYRLELDSDSTALNQCGDREGKHSHDFGHLTPSIFQRVSVDGLEFYEIYQRSHDLQKAISALEAESNDCCIIHGDLKFNNLLLHDDWPSWNCQRLPVSDTSLLLAENQSVIRLIDWEQWKWGDPAADLGALIADYLRIWLSSLQLSGDVDLTMALKLAAVPLEEIQPSLQGLIHAYTAQFPKVLEAQPGFMNRVLRFSGLGLISIIHDRLHYHEPFDIVEKSMLQVAKSLLCHPDAARRTLLGSSPASWLPPGHQPYDLKRLTGKQSRPIGRNNLSEVSLPLWTHDYSEELVLADIVRNISIYPDQIGHPAYEPFILGQTEAEDTGGAGYRNYHSLPEALQRKLLEKSLADYLYDIYFSGEQERRGEHPGPPSTLMNNTVSGIDIDFLAKLQIANHGIGFLDPDWLVVDTGVDRVKIEKDGLQLWAEPAKDLALACFPAGSDAQGSSPVAGLPVGTSVSLRMANFLFSGDSYIAIGNAGQPSADKTRLSVYCNISAKGAPILLDSFSIRLNKLPCPYTLRILNDPTAFPRYNSVTLEIEQNSYDCFVSILEDAYPLIHRYLSNPVPLFSHQLAPGIGLVECPEHDTDFGTVRCELLAAALLESRESSTTRQTIIEQKFIEYNLDFERPYLNPGSCAIYPFPQLTLA